mmetsp:Transcript_17499/g.35736  ORF Transcript_17499/g.35736 Transcript_17499/m.35736 type:complete len:230 (-) Transcript_17499:762-1451(-)
MDVRVEISAHAHRCDPRVQRFDDQALRGSRTIPVVLPAREVVSVQVLHERDSLELFHHQHLLGAEAGVDLGGGDTVKGRGRFGQKFAKCFHVPRFLLQIRLLKNRLARILDDAGKAQALLHTRIQQLQCSASQVNRVKIRSQRLRNVRLTHFKHDLFPRRPQRRTVNLGNGGTREWLFLDLAEQCSHSGLPAQLLVDDFCDVLSVAQGRHVVQAALELVDDRFGEEGRG